MAKTISNAIALIKAEFPSEWWKSYSFDKTIADAPNIGSEISRFEIKSNEIEDKIFDILNISILRGEYVESKEFIERLLLLKETIKGVRPTDEGFFAEDDVNNLLLNPKGSLLSGFVEPLKLAINYYHQFLLMVDNKLSISNKKYIQGNYNEEITRAVEENLCDDNSKSNLQLLQQNILVARIDHSLTISPEQDHVGKLIAVLRRLSDPNFKKQYALIIARKARFLSNKLKIRIHHELKGESVYNIINGKEVKIEVTEMLDNSIYDKWLIYSDVYTLESELINYIKAEYVNIRNKTLEERTTLELHKTIKYFKDADKTQPNSYNVIKEVEEEFKSRSNIAVKNKNRFNAYAFSICGNYAANNRLSIVCKDGYTTLNEAQELYKEVIGIQSRTGIKNFFAQVTFLKFLIDKIRKIFKNNSALKGLVEAREIINKCHQIDEEYRENVTWTADYYNYVFQLPFEECCLPTGNEEVDRVFVFSSFLLPLPKNKILKEYDEYQAEVAKYESSIVISENVSKEILVLDSLKDDLKGLKDKEYRMLEVLGIFTAIISFVAASLPTFKIIDTALEAAMFMLALATSLAVFVLLVLVVFRGLEKAKKHKIIIGGGFFSSAVLWGLLIWLDRGYHKPSIELENSNSNHCIQVDSSQVINNINNNVTCVSCNSSSAGNKPQPKTPADTLQKRTKKPPCP